MKEHLIRNLFIVRKNCCRNKHVSDLMLGLYQVEIGQNQNSNLSSGTQKRQCLCFVRVLSSWSKLGINITWISISELKIYYCNKIKATTKWQIVFINTEWPTQNLTGGFGHILEETYHAR